MAIKLRFKVGDRVVVAEDGLGTVTEVVEFWKPLGRPAQPCERPYRVLLDSNRVAPAHCREDELTPATDAGKSAKAGK